MTNESTKPENRETVGGLPLKAVVMHSSEVCPECGMNHRADVLRKESTQERMRHLRLALRIATGWDDDKYKDCLAAAEDQIAAAQGA